MSNPNPGVDLYLVDGCGRCSLHATPQCKVHNWPEEMKLLREILLECDLTEEIKWSMPCYTYRGANILMLSAFKEYAAINFFKGSLLKDPDGLLIQQTKNVQAGRQLRYTRAQDVREMAPKIKAFVLEAIEVEKSGQKIEYTKSSDRELPEELVEIFEADPALKLAFEALTPGRQKGYILHFSAPKQSKTRTARIEKSTPKIMAGKGFHDR